MRKIGRWLTIFLSVAFAAPVSSSAQEPVRIYNPAGVRPDGVFVDELLKRTMSERGKARPRSAGDFPRAEAETVRVRGDLHEEINELFYRADGVTASPSSPLRTKGSGRCFAGPTSQAITG